ncbi:glycoside hydrolase family 3 protein [Streptomyces sp. NPDC056105]|uniref:glycoside hydrolase family 3 protein n=1 Tax=Streptomyces sp. NPDC056105 TaxID=3345714 RepID=UPI0035D9C491
MSTVTSTEQSPRYLDLALSPEERAEDLLARMTLEEKAGLLFQPATAMNDDGTPLDAPHPEYAVHTATEVVRDRHITHLHLLNGEDPYRIAQWHNHIQDMAADTRLGIPVTVSTDPRHGTFSSPLTGETMEHLSRWPEHTGFGALPEDEAERRVEEYADVVRREYLAMGFRVALGPMADLFTEPRWSRGYGTFGEDPETVARLTSAFLRGLRGGDALGPDGVAAVVKHFPGGGPQLKGDDAHDTRYPEQVYPGGRRDLHLKPFQAAIEAGATQMMTYYGKPVGTDWPEVGFAFNKPVVEGILRGELGFDGIVVSDWYVIDRTVFQGHTFGPNAYGLEDRTPIQRLAAALDAGLDQFGGDDCTEHIVELVRSGQVSEERIDVSARRLLREKFRLGLFENRHVDPDQAAQLCGSRPLRTAGRAAQSDSTVLVKNDNSLLPVAPGSKVYVEGVDAAAFTGHAEIVTDPAAADLALLRLHAPYSQDPDGLISYFHGGDLAFTAEQNDHVRAIAAQAPTAVAVYLERPAVMPEIADAAHAILGDFGADDSVLAHLVLGTHAPHGHLPFDLPSSMNAVESHPEDVPFSTADPLYRYGHGLTYEG